LADHDRPLNRRGERNAALMADFIAAKAPRPDLILCSTSMRTRQTLAPLAKRLGEPSPPVSLERALYLAAEDDLFERLRALSDDVGTVLLIGHNEGIGLLAARLAGHGTAAALVALQEKFPTGALALMSAPIEHWSSLAEGTAELGLFVRPRDLDPA
jgi:phosphohistidine phosphatase